MPERPRESSQELSASELYAVPRSVELESCDFYHVMDLPSVGLVGGQWDLRGHVDEYLGHVDLRAKRVLEIGPASGFLTIEMERRGADVVAIEVTDDPGWDFVPYRSSVLDPIRLPRREKMTRIKNSFWFTHRAHESKSRLHYGDAADLPAALGEFDFAVMAAILLHARNPLAIIEECGRRATTLVITDRYHPELEQGEPICRLHPTLENEAWDTWWALSTRFLTNFLEILGHTNHRVTRHRQSFVRGQGGRADFFTIVASR